MTRSLALGLHLLLSGRGGAAPVNRPARPEGLLVWLHAAKGADPAAALQVARALSREKGRPRLLLSADAGLAEGLPGDWLTDAAPTGGLHGAEAFLTHWRPDAFCQFGADLAPAITVALAEAGVPMTLADATFGRSESLGWLGRRSMARALYSRFARILACDEASADRLIALTDGTPQVEVTGHIVEVADPLPHAEAEREALAAQFRVRPVWLAVAPVAAEIEAVLQAQAAALRLAHRTLLVLAPQEAESGPALAKRLEADGWLVALRSRDDETEAEVQILIADQEGELGLWYRLAPVAFLGGTLLGEGSVRSPIEAAALGSAIVAGPVAAGHEEAFARLGAARAFRPVRSAQALAEAVGELIQPDRAALLAHNAWEAATAGAGPTDRVVVALMADLAAKAAA
jgi:3-deoxy-D-manno-octulosonic-acid transferase